MNNKRLKIIRVILIIFVCTIFISCLSLLKERDEIRNKQAELVKYSTEYFKEIESWSEGTCKYAIVYDKNSKVKYLISESNYYYDITPLYNSDGTLQTYNLELQVFNPSNVEEITELLSDAQ